MCVSLDPTPPETHMSIHSLVSGQAWLVRVLGEVCWVRVYQNSLGPKLLGNGYLREYRKARKGKIVPVICSCHP